MLSLDGKEIVDTRGFNERILATPDLMKRSVEMIVWRSGREKALKIKFEAMPKRAEEDQVQLEGRHPLAGYVVEQLSPVLNQELNLPLTESGVVIVNTPGERIGLFGMSMRVGDILLEINGQKIKHVRDVQQALDRRARGWRFKYRRGNAVYQTMIQ